MQCLLRLLFVGILSITLRRAFYESNVDISTARTYLFIGLSAVVAGYGDVDQIDVYQLSKASLP